jgi:hypothetical protein
MVIRKNYTSNNQLVTNLLIGINVKFDVKLSLIGTCAQIVGYICIRVACARAREYMYVIRFIYGSHFNLHTFSLARRFFKK